MREQQKKTRGFTLLELLVIVVLVSIISALAYPNFTSWRTDRQVSQGAERVANIFKNLTSKSQGGAYPYTQFYACNGIGCEDDANAPPNDEPVVRFYGRGLFKQSVANIRNAGNIPQCSLTGTEWRIIDANNNFNGNDRISFYQSEEISIHFVDEQGAVCFFRDGTFYSTMGEINNNADLTLDSGDIINYIIICSRSNALFMGGSCPLTFDDGLVQPAYMIQWSRFGQITKYRLGRNGNWRIY